MLKLSATSKNLLIRAQKGELRFIAGNKHLSYLLREGYLVPKYIFGGKIIDPDELETRLANNKGNIMVYPICVLAAKGTAYLDANPPK